MEERRDAPVRPTLCIIDKGNTTIFDKRYVCHDGTTFSISYSSRESYRFYTIVYVYVLAYEKKGINMRDKDHNNRWRSKEPIRTKCRTI